jgi:MarR family transcriptional regulator, lower aerobic nicotinate degradation pathway regulator
VLRSIVSTTVPSIGHPAIADDADFSLDATSGATGSPISSAASAWHAFLLRKAAQRVTSMADVVLDPLHLTLRHFGLMLAVEDDPGANQRLIGQRLRIDRTTIVGIVDDLEAAKLIRRQRGTDRRSFALHLTAAGEARLAELKPLLGDVHREFLAPLTTAERMMLRDLLLKLTS